MDGQGSRQELCEEKLGFVALRRSLGDSCQDPCGVHALLRSHLPELGYRDQHRLRGYQGLSYVALGGDH